MKAWAWALIGGVAGVAITTRLVPANTSSCCRRVAVGARDTIADAAGPFSSMVSWTVDALGLTPHLPSILDKLGVPVD